MRGKTCVTRPIRDPRSGFRPPTKTPLRDNAAQLHGGTSDTQRDISIGQKQGTFLMVYNSGIFVPTCEMLIRFYPFTAFSYGDTVGNARTIDGQSAPQVPASVGRKPSSETQPKKTSACTKQGACGRGFDRYNRDRRPGEGELRRAISEIFRGSLLGKIFR